MESRFSRPAVLVSTVWAIAHLHDANLRFVEVDVDTSAYEKGHLLGAVGFNWQTQLNAPVRRDIPSGAEFEELMSSAGISNDTTVVLYGDNHNWFAAFAFWLFKYYGHEHVLLIDGGRKKLVDENRMFTRDVPGYSRAAYRIAGSHPELRARAESIIQLVQEGTVDLVDVRSSAEFTGEIIAPPGMSETAQRGGHIPGAVNIPWNQAVYEDGTFKSYQELWRLYRAKGLSTKQDTVTYCRIGERSAHTWFVLKYLLGFENVRNYDGSWMEYGNMIDVPIEKSVAVSAAS